MFEGSRRRKYQILIHNQKELQELGRECPSNGLCLRTGKPHEKWRPLVSKGRVEQFITGEEREYPPGFCSAYASAMTKAVRTKRVKSFCEIYSGPNAPFTLAMVREFGGCIPDVRPNLEKAPSSSKAEALSLDRRTALGLTFESSEVPTSKERPSFEPKVESTTLRSSAVEAGRQPSFGKRTQMIGDGINDPLRHLKEAMGLKHPFDSTSSVKEDHVRNTVWERDQADPNRERLALLNALESLSRDPEVIRRGLRAQKGEQLHFQKDRWEAEPWAYGKGTRSCRHWRQGRTLTLQARPEHHRESFVFTFLPWVRGTSKG